MRTELICVMHCSNCKQISNFDYYDFLHGRLEEFEQCPFCGSYDMPEIDEREIVHTGMISRKIIESI